MVMGWGTTSLHHQQVHRLYWRSLVMMTACGFNSRMRQRSSLLGRWRVLRDVMMNFRGGNLALGYLLRNCGAYYCLTLLLALRCRGPLPCGHLWGSRILSLHLHFKSPSPSNHVPCHAILDLVPDSTACGWLRSTQNDDCMGSGRDWLSLVNGKSLIGSLLLLSEKFLLWFLLDWFSIRGGVSTIVVVDLII
jgi:hypothetical protein